MVMLSAYVVTWMSRGGVGRSDTYLYATFLLPLSSIVLILYYIHHPY